MRPSPPSDGMRVSHNVALAPGTYVLPRGIEIVADGVTLEGNGATLVGTGDGIGLRLSGLADVRIRNLQMLNYRHGVLAQGCRKLHITDCGIHLTQEMAANTLFLDIWRPADEAYGSGILLQDVRDGAISGNNLQHQMVGLQLYDCGHLSVLGNIANYCSGAGFYLSRSSDCRFEQNFADFCCRYQPRSGNTGHMGADAAGFVIVRGSSRNEFVRNSARMSGDGFFVAGLPPGAPQPDGCDDNAFLENDASYSPNIAFEATFSRGNIFVGNTANYCNYGFWLGFSQENRLEDNEIRRNREAGIAVENGINMLVRENRFVENRYGILLWSRYVAAFKRAVPENDTSRDWHIEGNRFTGNRTGIRIAANQDHGVRPLPADSRETPLPLDHVIKRNRFEANVVGIEWQSGLALDLVANDFEGNLRAQQLLEPIP